MRINSHNEWDRLREVVVGTVEGRACLPFWADGPVTEEKLERIQELAEEAYPRWLQEEAEEDLEGLCGVLMKNGVGVYRPSKSTAGAVFSTPFWGAGGDRVYNMRDLHLIVDNWVIESPSQERHRYFEAMALYDVWYEYLEEGCLWVAAPKPRLEGSYLITQESNGKKYQTLKEEEILFEAANVVRMGRDLLYLVSRSGNFLGARWLQSVLGDAYRVHATEDLYRSSHIDSTVVCLKPGLVLLNGSRVHERNCPSLFEKWDKIYFTDIEPTPVQTIEFHERVRKPVCDRLAELGVWTDLDHMASEWIGMNVLSLDPETVLVDERQLPLIRCLERHGMTPVPIRFRHAPLFKGGIHCCTLDTVRDSRLESYFSRSVAEQASAEKKE